MRRFSPFYVGVSRFGYGSFKAEPLLSSLNLGCLKGEYGVGDWPRICGRLLIGLSAPGEPDEVFLFEGATFDFPLFIFKLFKTSYLVEMVFRRHSLFNYLYVVAGKRDIYFSTPDVKPIFALLI